MMRKFLSVVALAACCSLAPAWAEEAAVAAETMTTEAVEAAPEAEAVVTEAVVVETAVAEEAPAAEAAPVAPTFNEGNVAWMLVSTAFVLLMSLPGLALFYGGMVRSKNMLSTMTQTFGIFCLIAVLWCV
ncbi:MAG: ammonia channel protein, partial [Pseudomonadota bacterium]|nr:ammonia channel protein [Pseudomonadota bacterium]